MSLFSFHWFTHRYIYIYKFSFEIHKPYFLHTRQKKIFFFFWWVENFYVVWNKNKLSFRGNEAFSRFDRPGGSHSSDKYILNVCNIDTTNFLSLLPAGLLLLSLFLDRGTIFQFRLKNYFYHTHTPSRESRFLAAVSRFGAAHRQPCRAD